MLYEAHVTVEGEDVESWQKFCRNHNIKPVFIRLSRGKYPTQLMCTAAHNGDEASADDMVGQLMNDAERDGFNCLRAKLERPLVAECPDGMEYAECHIKLLLDGEVAEIAEPEVFLSESLLGVESPLRKWYFTARTYGLDAQKSEHRFQEVLRQLQPSMTVVRMETEAVVYDTNPDLDRGWAH